MRVGFGCTVLAKGLNHGGVDGIGSYTNELGRSLSATKAADLIPVSFGVPINGNFPLSDSGINVLPRFAPMAAISAVTPFAFFGNENLRRQIDVFHATDHLVPKFSGFPVVATLMDAIPLSHPQWVRVRLAKLKGRLWQRSARWADHILTISEYSKSDIVKYFGISPDKITVTPLGVDERYFERIDPARKAEILKQYGLPERFYLFVGTLQPRKNVERLLDAHEMLPLNLQKEIPLVIVGRAGWGCEALVARLENAALSGRIVWLKYLPDESVRALLQTALALVFPSLYEGFGLPVVEAFASGLPVIASDTTALPEVTLDAALLINPLDAGAISDAMRQMAEVSGMARKFAEAGERRARQLTWAACAAKTLDVYRKIL
ncbi:MAG TPA: glycosyltransferase family 1 protein [Burkholderiales bacterium]|nr:glycosyltransferase family 1 protein [Burkholderiales bacterium]